MRIAISIPTYRAHLAHNFAFMQSVSEHRSVAPIPEIFFTTGDESERIELEAFRDTLPPEVATRIHVTSLHQELSALSEPAFAPHHDSGFAYGMIGFITYKKFLGVARAFSQGFDHVVILDSEVVQFRDADLTASLRRAIELDEYRSSVTAYREPWATKVQHDSLRSVVQSYDTTAVFARSYGWYDNLCTFERQDFAAFITFMAGEGSGDPVLRATHRFRGFGFDWIVFQVWRTLVAGRALNMIDLDQRLISAGVTLKPKPQTENLFLYFNGDVDHDAGVLRALNPPWVPFTRNARYIDALHRGTPDTCCLMFHADRSHPGAAPLPNFKRRVIRFLMPYIRRCAKKLMNAEMGA